MCWFCIGDWFLYNLFMHMFTLWLYCVCEFAYLSINLMVVYVHLILQYLSSDYKELCQMLEPQLTVREKEDFATCLVHVLQKQGKACEFLSDIVIEEISQLGKRTLCCFLTFLLIFESHYTFLIVTSIVSTLLYLHDRASA